MLHLEFWIRFTQFYTFTVFACGAFNSRAIKSFYFLVLVLLRMTNVPLPSDHDRARSRNKFTWSQQRRLVWASRATSITRLSSRARGRDNVRDGSMSERNLNHYELSRVWQKQELIPKLPQFIVECIRWSPLAHQKKPISSSVFSLQPLPSWIWCPGANQWSFWEQKVDSYANNILKGSNRTIWFVPTT